jgi:hypothetical protein
MLEAMMKATVETENIVKTRIIKEARMIIKVIVVENVATVIDNIAIR